MPYESVLALVGVIDQVGALTYGVVLRSILLQGVTIGPVARRLLGHGQAEGALS